MHGFTTSARVDRYPHGAFRQAIRLAGWVVIACLEANAVDSSNGNEIAERFRRLTRASSWRKADEVKLAFRTYHPQGMTIIGDCFFLSSVEVLDRGEGRGVGHLFEVDFQGRLLRQIRLGAGQMYHPGGIDYDGKLIWVPVAEYRPDSRTMVYRVDPTSLEAWVEFEFADHIGALVSDGPRRSLIGVSWGSRRFYRWEMVEDGEKPVKPDAPLQSINAGHYVDFQDGQSLPGTSWALFGGVGRLAVEGVLTLELGGLELVDLGLTRAVHQVPVGLRTAHGDSMVRNPFAVRAWGKGLRFYFLPEDDESTLHVYDVE